MLLRLLLSASLLAPSPAAAPEPPPFSVGTDWLHGVWSDGDGLLAVTEHGEVHLSCRTGEQTTVSRAYGLLRVHGRWVDGGPVVAAVTEDGKLLRWRAGAWTRHGVPDVSPVDVAVDTRGRVVVAGASGGARRLDGEVWQALSYPLELQRAVAVTVGGDDSVLVVGADGELARDEPGADAMRRILVLGLPDAPLYAWRGPGTLWIADARQLVAVDTTSWKLTRRVDPGLFGQLRGITGLAAADGDLIAIAAQSSLLLTHGDARERVSEFVTFPGGLAFDVRAGALLATHSSGLRSTPLDHPALLAARDRLRAGGPARPCPLAAGQTTRDIDALAPVPGDSSPPAPAPAPAPTPPAAPELAKILKRAPLEPARPTLRLGLGVAFAPGAAADPRITTGFALDLAVGAHIPVHRLVSLWPELGYSLTTRDGRAGHFIIAGLTPLYGNRKARIGLAPRLVAGDAWGAPGVGVRSGLIGTIGYNALSIEVGHQWLRADGRDLHDGRLLISVEMGVVVRAMAGLWILGKLFRFLRR